VAKAPGQVTGWLRQVTQPPFIAGPLAFTWEHIRDLTETRYVNKKILALVIFDLDLLLIG
jgi:hypothetical protein